MKKKTFLIFFTVIASIFCAFDDWVKQEKGIIIDENQFYSLISKNEYVIVKFYGDRCPWCKKMSSDIDKLWNYIQENHLKVTLAKIDAHQYYQSVCKAFGIRSLPTLLLFGHGKKEPLARYEGYRPSNDLIGWMNSYINK